jgi:hypothetical protein
VRFGLHYEPSLTGLKTLIASELKRKPQTSQSCKKIKLRNPGLVHFLCAGSVFFTYSVTIIAKLFILVWYIENERRSIVALMVFL